MSVSLVLANAGQLLDGPHWDGKDNVLLYVDISSKCVHRCHPTTGQDEKVQIGEVVSSIIPTSSGKLLVTTGRRIGYLDWNTGDVTTVVEVDAEFPSNRLNDAKCDSAGRLWTGTMGPSKEIADGRCLGQGSLYCLRADKTIVKAASGFDLANGLCWSLDDKILYLIDSIPGTVIAFDVNMETGDLSNRRVAVTIPRDDGMPDGLTIDSEGMLWLALVKGSKVVRYNPITGEKMQTIDFPCSNITSCTWGGANLDELYVTSDREMLPKEQQAAEDKAGSLFKVTGLGITGAPSHVYKD